MSTQPAARARMDAFVEALVRKLEAEARLAATLRRARAARLAALFAEAGQ